MAEPSTLSNEELLRQTCYEYSQLLVVSEKDASSSAAVGDPGGATSPVSSPNKHVGGAGGRQGGQTSEDVNLAPGDQTQPGHEQSDTATGVEQICNVTNTYTQKVIELQGVLEGAENDLTVTTDVLLPQLLENSQNIENLFKLIDDLGRLVHNLECSAKATRDKSKAVQAAYRARNPQKIEKFLGSLNMFRSKSKDNNVSKPPMPDWAPVEVPDVDTEFRRLRSQAWN